MLDQLHHCDTVTTLSLVASAELTHLRVSTQQLAHGTAETTGAFPVDYAHEGQLGHVRIIQVLVYALHGIVHQHPSHFHLQAW
jgi:hypothetical protein